MPRLNAVFLSVLVLFLSACSSSSTTESPATDDSGAGAGNQSPIISGSPATSVVVGSSYTFIPTASDGDISDELTFSITNKPSWASFDNATGVLSGAPAVGGINYTGIVISVSDGQASAALAEFNIDVQAGAGGAVQNHVGIPLPHVLLTHDPDSKGVNWQANPDPWIEDPRTAETPSHPANWPSLAEANHWYIDNTDVNATDVNMGDNAVGGIVYGTPDRPRATLMGQTVFTPGAYIEIQGGPYNSGIGRWRFECTSGDPCWVTSDSVNKAILAGSARFTLEGSSWLTIENLLWDPEAAGATVNTSNTAIATSYNGTAGDTHHITLRHLDFRRWSFISGGGGIIAVGSDNRNGGHQAHHVLVYKVTAIEAGNNASRGCDWAADDCDNHLVGITSRIDGGVTANSTHHVWVLDTHSDQISGNQVQAISFGFPVVDWREIVHHIYVGGGTHTNSRQGGWWAKRSTDFVVSSSRAWNLRAWDGSNGQASGMQYGPNWVWFINNDYHDVDFGVQQTDTGTETTTAENGILFVLGNRFYDIGRHSLPTKTDAWRGGFGVSAWHGSSKHYIAFNTCVSCESGLSTKIRTMNNSDEGAYIWNNIVHSIDDTVGRFISYDANGFGWAQNNLFWDDANFKLLWNSEMTSLTDWEISDGTHVNNNLNSDPLLTNTTTTYPARDFSLGTGSPATDTGVVAAGDSLDPFVVFSQRYGMDISKDVMGNVRSAPYSMGAYE